MKKLMIATAALCAAVGANALESANTVGYTDTTITKDGRLTVSGVPFVQTAGGNLSLSDIVPTVDGAVPGDGAFLLTWYDRTTGGYKSAGWCEGTYPTAQDAEDDTNWSDTPAWGDGDYVVLSKVFAAGEWALVQPNLDGTSKLQVAGALATTDATAPANAVTIVKDGRLTAVGNPLPCSVEIQEITGTVNDAVAGDGAFLLTWYDRTTGGYKSAGWCEGTYPTAQDAEDDTNWDDTPAWGDGDYVEISKTFAVGEGALVQPNLDGTSKLLFPNPFYTVTP